VVLVQTDGQTIPGQTESWERALRCKGKSSSRTLAPHVSKMVSHARLCRESGAGAGPSTACETQLQVEQSENQKTKNPKLSPWKCNCQI
jgi:hypothetical protein